MSTKVLIAHGSTQRLKRAVADLQAHGFEVAATPDGGDAFARFFEESPDVVLSSESLPGLSGVNFARMVRSQSPTTPLFLLVEGEPGPELAGFQTLPDPLDVEALCRAIPDLIPVAPPAGLAAPARATTTVEVFTLAALKRFQRGSHLLALLDEAGVARMARMAEQRLSADGERILRQGEPGDSFYLVVEGQVRVTLREQDDAEVARIGEGGFFGEMALLSDQPRQASVWSVGATTLLRFGRHEFLPMLDAYPSMRELLSGVALERSEENLWSVLLADDEVQQSLAGLGDDAPTPTPELDTAVADLLAAEQAAVAELSATSGTGEDRTDFVAENEGTRDSSAAQKGKAVGRASQHSDARGEFQALRAPPSPGALAVLGARLRGLTREAPREAFVFVGATGFVVGIIVTLVAAGMMTRRDGPATLAVNAVAEDEAGSVGAAGAAIEEADEEAAGGTEDDGVGESESEPKAAQRPEGDLRPLSDVERKELRKQLFASYRAKDYAGAIEVGHSLRSAAKIDWEAEFLIAEAERAAGANGEALASYLAFIEKYPTNVYADDARFWAAEILLGQGKKAEAKVLYQRILASPKTRYRSSAESRLGEL